MSGFDPLPPLWVRVAWAALDARDWLRARGSAVSRGMAVEWLLPVLAGAGIAWLLGLAGCASRPCSVRAAAALDAACAQTVVETWAHHCPAAELEACPEAALVLAACDAAIVAHAAECGR